MQANELRIGNYFNDRAGKLLKLDWWESINKACCKMEIEGKEVHPMTEYVESCTPILLTEEWLVKFGFKKVRENTKHFKVDFFHYENDDCWIYLILDGFELELNTSDERHNLDRTYKYVHQLQNLYFALTGKELTIKK